MCTCGIAIATQQAMPAKARTACSALGERPSGVVAAPPAAAGRAGSAGARGRSMRASGSIVTTHTAPITRCVWRQPIVPMPHCSSGGHSVPAR